MEVVVMPRGGARVNSGPPPDPNALRRDRKDDKDGWTVLPAGGRTDPPPEWPLRLNAAITPEAAVLDEREAHLWVEVWAKPQAVMWEQQGTIHDVALYVRWLVMAEAGDMKAAAEARQWSDRLGMNSAAMLRNRWRVSGNEVGQRRSERAVSAAPRKSSRDRLRVVGSADGA